jgi:HEAT repeats/Putative zinc-finger
MEIPEMQRESGGERQAGPCPEFEQSLVLYAVGELAGAERQSAENHLQECVACAAFLDEGQRLLAVVRSAQPDEPDVNLLASCRSALADALDQAGEPGRFTRWAGLLLSGNWFGLPPALGAALLLLIGFSVGTLAPRLLRTTVSQPTDSSGSVANQAALLNDQIAHGADISRINVTPAGENVPPQVEVQLSSPHPLVVSGNVNDNDVKRVFLYVLQNSARFSPDVRLDSVELLKPRYQDADVTLALCQLVRSDSNTAVRLKAQEALRSCAPSPQVLSALLETLAGDSNPGVRVEAANALLDLVDKGGVLDQPGQMDLLRDRMQKDSNNYVRLQSAAIIRRSQAAGKF